MQNFVMNALAIFPAAILVMAVVFAVCWRRNVQAGNGDVVARASEGQAISALVITAALLALLIDMIVTLVCSGINIASIVQGW